MADRLLVPFDGSPLSERALEHAVEKFPTASITTLYVINPLDSLFDVEVGGLPAAERWYDEARDRADAVNETAAAVAAEHGVDVADETVVGRPARAILEYVEEHDIDQVVMGSHGREWVERAILGSVAETVMRRARVPVTVVR